MSDDNMESVLKIVVIALVISLCLPFVLREKNEDFTEV